MIYYAGFAFIGVGTVLSGIVFILGLFSRGIFDWIWLGVVPCTVGFLLLFAVTLYERFTDDEHTKYKDKN